MGTSQKVDTDDDLMFAVQVDQLALQTGEGAFDNPDRIARREGGGAEFDGLGTVVEHEAEAFHLLVGDDGRCMLATQDHVAADR